MVPPTQHWPLLAQPWHKLSDNIFAAIAWGVALQEARRIRETCIHYSCAAASIMLCSLHQTTVWNSDTALHTLRFHLPKITARKQMEMVHTYHDCPNYSYHKECYLVKCGYKTRCHSNGMDKWLWKIVLWSATPYLHVTWSSQIFRSRYGTPWPACWKIDVTCWVSSHLDEIR